RQEVVEESVGRMVDATTEVVVVEEKCEEGAKSLKQIARFDGDRVEPLAAEEDQRSETGAVFGEEVTSQRLLILIGREPAHLRPIQHPLPGLLLLGEMCPDLRA